MVPIINSNINLLNKILNTKCFIFRDFKISDKGKIKHLIDEKQEFINSNNINNCFTSLFPNIFFLRILM